MAGKCCRSWRLALCVVWLLLASVVVGQSSPSQWEVYQKTDVGTCVPVALDSCYSCTTRGVRGNETRSYRCSFDGSVQCASSAATECEEPSFAIQTREAGCDRLRMCQVGQRRTAVFVFEVEAEDGLEVLAGEDSAWWMQANSTRVRGYGDIASVTVQSGDSSVTFAKMSGPSSYSTSAGDCAVGEWCEAGGMEYRLVEVSIEEATPPIPPSYIISLEKNDDYTVAVKDGSENLVEVEGGRTNVDDDALAKLVMTFEDLAVYNLALAFIYSDSPTLSYTVETDDGDTFPEQLDCSWKSGWPHGYYSSIAWYYSFGFSGQVVHCNFDSMFDSGNYLAAHGYDTIPAGADAPLFHSAPARVLSYVRHNWLAWL